MSERSAAVTNTRQATASTPAPSGLLQRTCACGNHAAGGECEACKRKREEGVLQRQVAPAAAAPLEVWSPPLPSVHGRPIQAKLRINQPGDAYEQEADRIAAAVMGSTGSAPTAAGVPSASSLQARHANTESSAGTAPPIVHEVLRESGASLDPATRAFVEPRFGRDFGDVRVHTGARAAASARAVNALAYTVGRDVVFGAGQYAPGTGEGRRLLAHELAHVVQQGVEPESRVRRRQATRELDEEGKDSKLAPRDVEGRDFSAIEDPAFLLCIILCYLGIPPSLIKAFVEFLLRATVEEYSIIYDRESAQANFRSYREEFRLYSALKVFQRILRFVIFGELSLGIKTVTIKHPAATAIRQQALNFLIRRGATSAYLELAEKVARKIFFAIEVLFAVGCGAYCGGKIVMNALIAAGRAISDGIASFVTRAGGVIESLESWGGRVARFFVRSFLVARATVNPFNWKIDNLPARTRAHLNVIGLTVWSSVRRNDPNQSISNMSQLLKQLVISKFLDEIGNDITTTLHKRGGFYSSFYIRGSDIGQLSLLNLIQTMHSWKLIEFQRSPEVIADESLRANPIDLDH